MMGDPKIRHDAALFRVEGRLFVPPSPPLLIQLLQDVLSPIELPQGDTCSVLEARLSFTAYHFPPFVLHVVADELGDGII